MQDYWSNRWVKIGAALAVIGWTPLGAILLLSALGLWPDPEPNPIGPGLLCFFSFWPAVLCLTIGMIQVHRKSPD